MGRTLLMIWTTVIILLVVPWTSFQDHAHWTRIAWIPFVSPPVTLLDAARNVLLYIPWGYLAAHRTCGRDSALRVIGVAFVLSMTTEASQLMSHGRFPSATDVVCNVAGAWGGILWTRRLRSCRCAR
jgi:glycopeptide antibiotics resistance protein